MRDMRLAIALLLLAPLLVVACGDGDEDEPRSFHIVFHSDRDGDDDIYVMRDDGSELQRLTNEPGRDYEPSVAPDGTIVFVSDRVGGGSAQLYLMDPDGSNVRRLTFSAGSDNRVIDDYPRWSPDGDAVVFQRTMVPDEGPSDADIWMIDVATGDETQLTDTPDDWDSTPSFTADGTAVLFESNRSGNYEIYRLDLDTDEITQLTDTDANNYEAKPSPDGEHIVFSSNRDGAFHVYVMDITGENVRRLTSGEGDNRCPHVSPDGERVSFYSNRDGDEDIFVIDFDGENEVRLTDAPGNDQIPSWADLGE
jgi:TolB protein